MNRTCHPLLEPVEGYLKICLRCCSDSDKKILFLKFYLKVDRLEKEVLQVLDDDVHLNFGTSALEIKPTDTTAFKGSFFLNLRYLELQH